MKLEEFKDICMRIDLVDSSHVLKLIEKFNIAIQALKDIEGCPDDECWCIARQTLHDLEDVI